MTYPLSCPTCGFDAADHRRLVPHEIKGDDDVTVTMIFDEADFDACDRTAASLYAEECRRLAAAANAVQSKHAVDFSNWNKTHQAVSADRDRLRGEVERLKSADVIPTRTVMSVFRGWFASEYGFAAYCPDDDFEMRLRAALTAKEEK